MEARAHVDHHRRLMRHLVEGFGGHQHAAQRFHRQIHPRQARHVARPRAGGIDHRASGDEPSRSLDARHSLRVRFDARDVGIAHQAHAALHGLQHEARHHAVRVHETIGRAETAAQDVVLPQFGSDARDILRIQQVHRLESGIHLVAVILAQILQMSGSGGDEKISLRAVARRVAHHFIEPAEERDGVHRHADVDRRGELGAHAAHALSGGSLTLRGFAFDHHHVAAPRFGQVIRDAGADNAAPDDNDIRRVQTLLLLT